MIAAAANNGTRLQYFTPARLRDALRTAGNIVRKAEIAEVLSYVVKDGSYSDLNNLHLILLKDGSIKQIKWNQLSSTTYFVFADSQSEKIFDLMAANKHQLVEHSPAWTKLSRWE